MSGTCDRIMVILLYWLFNYEKGQVAKTNQYLTKPGEEGPQPHLKEIITCRACPIPWHNKDLEYLIKILENRAEEWKPFNDPDSSIRLSATARDLRAAYPFWNKGKLCQNSIVVNRQVFYLPNPVRTIEMVFYSEDVMRMYRLLEGMRDGKTKEAGIDLSKVDLASFSNSRS